MQEEQTKILIKVSTNLVAPLRSTINKSWGFGLFKNHDKAQIAAINFGKELNRAVPLNDGTAVNQDNCLSHLVPS